MKKNILVLMCITLMGLLLMGCEINKEVITSKEFSEKMLMSELTINDVTDQFEKGSVESVLIAFSDTYQIEFYVVSSEEQAINAYEENKTAFELIDAKASSQNEVTLGNYSTYSKTTEDLFIFVSRVENTFIYVVTEKSNKEVVEPIIDSLGY